MDALSDVLRAVRLKGAVFFDVHATSPWVAESPAGSSVVSSIFPGADHLIPYHAVTRGSCWAAIIDREPIPLSAGDIIVFPHGDAHALSSTPGLRHAPDLSQFQRPADGQLPFQVAMGGGGDAADVVCGFFGCNTHPFNPLLTALPPVIRVSDRDGGSLATFMQAAKIESKQPRMGGDVVLGHLSELMFVDVVRRHLETLPADRTGWLAGLRDGFVGRALAALHRHPERDWTLDTLARDVGLSRSALAERFTAYVGQPPIQYLTSWRMQLASNYLLSGSDSIAEIADRVGYDSEAAFSRAFKKAVGMPPSEWRRPRARPSGLEHAALDGRNSR